MLVFTKIKVTIDIWKPSLEKMTQDISLIPVHFMFNSTGLFLVNNFAFSVLLPKYSKKQQNLLGRVIL